MARSLHFVSACVHLTCVPLSVHVYIHTCMNKYSPLYMPVFACLCVSGEICGTLNCVGLLFRNVFALSQDVGVVSIAPWLGSVSKCQCWVVVGRGCSTQPKAMASLGLARKAVVLVFHHFFPLLHLHWLPQSRLFLITSLVPSPSQGQVKPPLPHPS